MIAFTGCRASSPATNRILRLPSPGGRVKRKTPEQLADPVGLFGRSRTLCKFCGRVSDSFAERFKLITL
jgi:hypothetical protein